MLPRMEHDRWMAASKQAGVPTARNGPPERIPTCDWDAGISEREKETNRMFVRGTFDTGSRGAFNRRARVGLWQRHGREAQTSPGQQVRARGV
jgi:hypothetical protein